MGKGTAGGGGVGGGYRDDGRSVGSNPALRHYHNAQRHYRRFCRSKWNQVAVFVFVVAIFAFVPPFSTFAQGMYTALSGGVFYGGMYGRTWELRSPIDSFDPNFIRDIYKSNFAGVEEEGWFSQTYQGLLEQLWGAPCMGRIRSGLAQSDGAACPCMTIIRDPLRQEINKKEKNGGALSSGIDGDDDGIGGIGGHGADGIYYLKLHKVGSTTVTNALMNRCMEWELMRMQMSLSKVIGAVDEHTAAFEAAKAANSTYRFHLATPEPLKACLNLPLRISHNSIQSFMGAGTCSGAKSIGACLLRGGKTDRQGLSLVVLRDPLSRLVSSIYYWNCNKANDWGDGGRTHALLKAMGANLTATQMREVLKHGRTDSDEQLITLSRGTMNAKDAIRNLNHFDVVGITEDMTTFLAKVALTQRWAPETLATGKARSRLGNSAADGCVGEGSPSSGAASAADPKEPDRCAVRVTDFSAEVLEAMREFVNDEMALYQAAKEIHANQNRALPGLADAVRRLQTAQSQVEECKAKDEAGAPCG